MPYPNKIMEIKAIAEETGLSSAYDHFAEGESPDPPFLLYLFPSTDHFSADGIPYNKKSIVHFELYAATKKPDLETSIETVLEKHSLFYRKSEVWIPDEKLYEVLYETEVLL